MQTFLQKPLQLTWQLLAAALEQLRGAAGERLQEVLAAHPMAKQATPAVTASQMVVAAATTLQTATLLARYLPLELEGVGRALRHGTLLQVLLAQCTRLAPGPALRLGLPAATETSPLQREMQRQLPALQRLLPPVPEAV